MLPAFDCTAEIGWFRTTLGLLGVTVAACLLIWLVIGWFGWVPTMVEVFGIVGMRTPASFAVGGLLLAAISFWKC